MRARLDDRAGESQAQLFMRLSDEERAERMAKLTPAEIEALKFYWPFWARPQQVLPPLSWCWDKWLIMAGRGFGKTRTGAETVREWVKTNERVNLIGATTDDVRDIMIEGDSGIMAVCSNDDRPQYVKHERKLRWPNGATSLLITADEPERLRGKQHHKGWMDELAAWRYYQEVYDQFMFGLRLGSNPQVVITTTPRPLKLLKDLLDDPRCVVTKGRTADNEGNLAATFLTNLMKKYDGTRLARQELEAELLDDVVGALFTRTNIDQHRRNSYPRLIRVAVGMDPAVTSNSETSAETGIIAVGVGEDNHVYVLDDKSLSDKPAVWAKLGVELAKKHHGTVVAEVNNGGDLIEAVVKAEDPNVKYEAVRASVGKLARAEPVSMLYEQGRVHHVGNLSVLEDQMVEYSPQTAKKSPDRMDALVWAITYLAVDDPLAGTGVLTDGFLLWPTEKAPKCESVYMGLYINADRPVLEAAYVVLGVGNFGDHGKQAGILLSHGKYKVGAPELVRILNVIIAKHKPVSIATSKSGQLRWLHQAIRGMNVPLRTLPYDTALGPTVGLDAVKSKLVWRPNKHWAKDLGTDVSRYPHDESANAVHALTLALMIAGRRAGLKRSWDQEDVNQPEERPNKAIYA